MSGVGQTYQGARAREGNISPFFVASVLLHGAVAAFMVFVLPLLQKPTPIGVVVPVTIVTRGPPDLKAAEQGPQDQTAQTEESLPQAPPEPAPPPPAPAPAPPAPQAKPTPAKPTPAPAPAAAAKEKTFDFDALQKSIATSRSKNPAPQRPSNAPRGPSRPETAVEARPALGAAQGLSAPQMAALGAQLERLWNPNCEVEGGANVNLIVEATISTNGRLIGAPRVTQGLGPDAITQAAALRAVTAFRRAEPFDVPPNFRQTTAAFRFNAKSACGR